MTGVHNGARTLHEGLAATYLCSGDGATALVADHGAHVLSWIPAGGKEALFLSTASRYGNGTAIRGGVPIIFPQFAEQGNGRRHGFARIASWQLLDVGLTADGAATACWRLQGLFDAPAGAGPVGSYCLTFDVRLAADTIEFSLNIGNPSATTWECNAALHTYLKVDDLATSTIEGLRAAPYVDQSASGELVIVQPAAQLCFDAEVDRIYPQAPSAVRLLASDCSVIVEQTGFSDLVVWNPGAEKAAALSDLQKEGFRNFVCMEAAAIMQPISLAPDMSWHGGQRLQVITN